MIIFFWRGLGFLVGVIVFGFSLIGNLIFNATYGDGYYDNHKWPLGCTLIASATVCWFLGRKLRQRPEREMIDKNTGEEFILRQPVPTFFLIPMDYWAAILLVIAVWCIVAG